ncbi:MAG: hypothetical protein ABW364_02480 [Rhodococcus fascians]
MGDGTVDVDAGQQLFGSIDRQRSTSATLDHQAQQGVQPADRAGSVGGDLMITIGEHWTC